MGLWLIDLAIGLVLAEIGVLLLIPGLRRRLPWRCVLPNASAGLMLMLLARTLAGTGWSPAQTTLLACAGAAHALDLYGRLRSKGRRA